MKNEKLKKTIENCAKNLSINPFNQKKLKERISAFVESGNCVPTTDLLNAMEKAGSNPKQLARNIVGYDMNVNQKSYGKGQREHDEKEIAEVIQAAYTVHKERAKDKRRQARLTILS
jgi:hypothetical protein